MQVEEAEQEETPVWDKPSPDADGGTNPSSWVTLEVLSPSDSKATWGLAGANLEEEIVKMSQELTAKQASYASRAEEATLMWQRVASTKQALDRNFKSEKENIKQEFDAIWWLT